MGGISKRAAGAAAAAIQPASLSACLTSLLYSYFLPSLPPSLPPSLLSTAGGLRVRHHNRQPGYEAAFRDFEFQTLAEQLASRRKRNRPLPGDSLGKGRGRGRGRGGGRGRGRAAVLPSSSDDNEVDDEADGGHRFLTPVGPSGGRGGGRGGGQGRGGGRSGPAGGRGSAAAAHTWVLSAELLRLEFDQEALKQALRLTRPGRSSRCGSGVSSVADRVYLSRATLVVVPAVLLGHWQQQVAVSEQGGRVMRNGCGERGRT